MTESESIVHDVLTRSFPGKPLRAQRAFTRAGMSPEELVRLYEIVLSTRAMNVLEVGMGSGTSSVVMLTALAETGGRLTSVDPFQTASFKGAGQGVVAAAGHGARHRLIEKPDYLALPELLAAGERFDMILVDGYHSFDYTLVDVFYADLLLRTDGVLAVHDSSWPAVLASLQFLQAHKPYRPVSPPPADHAPRAPAQGGETARDLSVAETSPRVQRSPTQLAYACGVSQGGGPHGARVRPGHMTTGLLRHPHSRPAATARTR